jgi:trehalose 6-phosphate synthase
VLGFLSLARVGLVTPLRDGMNLVAKEHVAAQPEEDPGVLVLSEFAGAAHELAGALVVNPYDPEGVAEALDRALAMSSEERRERHVTNLRAIVSADARAWARAFLAELGNVPRRA